VIEMLTIRPPGSDPNKTKAANTMKTSIISLAIFLGMVSRVTHGACSVVPIASEAHDCDNPLSSLVGTRRRLLRQNKRGLQEDEKEAESDADKKEE
jgi:hypothetical protein